MGAVCYKAKKASLSREDVLRALQDKAHHHTITEPDFKTEEQPLLTFAPGSTKTNTVNDTSENIGPQGLQPLLSPADLEIKILSYFATKEDAYYTVAQLSKSSLTFLRKSHR